MPVQMKKVSLLLGSGFSQPAEFPSANELSESLLDICNIKGDDSELPSHKEKVIFNKALLDFYISDKIRSESSFNYELFFDWYNDLRDQYLSSSDLFPDFCTKFRETTKVSEDDQHIYQDLFRFNGFFQQQIANRLWKDPSSISYSRYEEFTKFLKHLSDSKCEIHVHTLNHDLFFEGLSASSSMELCDGFEEAGSPYYGEVGNGTRRRLERFVDSFDHQMCLYKLHGSIDLYCYNFGNREFDMIKSPPHCGIWRLLKESVNKYGERSYHDNRMEYPVFLTGVKRKTRLYSHNLCFDKLFQRFDLNLSESDGLIICGYGFQDDGINQYLEGFIARENTVFCWINETDPRDVRPGLFERAQTRLFPIPKYLERVSFDELNRIVA